MEAKYVQAIKAGIIGGIVLSICIIIYFFIYIGVIEKVRLGVVLLYFCVWLIMLLVMLGTGAFTMRLASTSIKRLDESAIIGAVSGAIAGAIVTVAQAITAIFLPIAVNYSYLESMYNLGDLGSLFATSTLVSLGTLCCCGPFYMITGTILAATGAVIYATLITKIK